MSRALLAAACALLALAWPALRAFRRERVGALVFVAPLAIYPALVGVALAIDRLVVADLLPDPSMWVVALAFFGYVLALPLGYVVLLLAVRRRHRVLAPLGLALCVLALGFGSWSWLVEPTTLRQRRYVVVTPRAPRRPLTILHVSDLQTDGPCRREQLAIAAIARGKADLVVFTGDFMNDDHPSKRRRVAAAAHAFARALRAPLGAYAVLGDWDGWGEHWPAQLRTILGGTSLRVLRNERVDLAAPGGGPAIALFGIAGGPRGQPRRPTIATAAGLRIVAVHNADDAARLLRAGEADLVLSGHTHGGQIVLPGLGALVTHSELGFAGGRHAVAGIPLLISRGIGMRGNSAPRIRFNCAPEISWISVRRRTSGSPRDKN